MSRPRQWIYDRVHGMSKLGKSKPPLSICYPPPILKCCPCLCEENCICTCCGGLGFYDGDDRAGRESVMRIAFSANICAFILTVYALISLYHHPTVIQISSLNRGRMDATDAKGPISALLQNADGTAGTYQKVQIDIGWRSIVIDNPNTFDKEIIFFDQFCDLRGPDRGMDNYVEPNKCNDCHDVRYQMIISILVGTVAYVPSMGTDLNRLHKNYDVNCQRVLALLLSAITIAGSVYAYLTYEWDCFPSFHSKGQIAFDLDGNLVDVPDDFTNAPNVGLIMKVNWEYGNGLIIWWAAAGLKVIHFFCHVCIPTPKITRNREEQEAYESIGQEEDGLLDVMEDVEEDSDATSDPYHNE